MMRPVKVRRNFEPGYAGIPTFNKLPLVLDPKELQGADVAILGAPTDDMVTNRPGARFGPRSIRTAADSPDSWHLDLGVDPFDDLKVVDHGDAEVRPGDAEWSHRSIARSVGDILSAGAIPIILGGDHSIAFPDIRAVADALEPGSLAVVQFDTHADTGKENWGVEWAHGTPFRNLIDRKVLAGERLVQVGLRGYWPYPQEFEWARAEGVRWHRMEEIAERGIEAVMHDVLDEIKEAEHVFLSVDIDVLDPAFAPGTGTPEPGGMSTRDLMLAVRRLVLARGLAGMEVVEVSPPYDQAEVTALAAQRIVLEALSALAVGRRGGEARAEDPSPGQKSAKDM